MLTNITKLLRVINIKMYSESELLEIKDKASAEYTEGYRLGIKAGKEIGYEDGLAENDATITSVAYDKGYEQGKLDEQDQIERQD